MDVSETRNMRGHELCKRPLRRGWHLLESSTLAAAGPVVSVCYSHSATFTFV